MKKFLAILMAAMMLMSVCALAEEPIPESVEMAEPDENAFELDWSVRMDALPEGYHYEEETIPGSVIASFVPDSEDSPTYLLTVGYSEEMSDIILNEEMLNDNLNLENIVETLAADFADPHVSIKPTEYGTACVLIDENGSDSEYGMIYSEYLGYEGIVYIFIESRELTEADFETGLKIMSDLQIERDGVVVTRAE